jgi:hypothetical protein
MPDITFFTPPKLRADYTYERRDNDTAITVGDWEFKLKSVEPVYDLVYEKYDIVGYAETYTNPDITQEELDVLWKKYLEETRQSGEL